MLPGGRLLPFPFFGFVRNEWQVLYSGREIIVVSEGLEAHSVFQCDCKGDEHVAEGDLGEQIFGGGFWSLVNVDPD